MYRIIIVKFDVSHNFMSNCFQFILPLNERKFLTLEHNVSCKDFVTFVNYDKEQFGDKIQQFFHDIRKHRRVTSIGTIGWFTDHLWKKH